MNLSKIVSPAGTLAFKVWRSLTALAPGGRMQAFGAGVGQIGKIVVINLDRQPRRWRRIKRELARFRTSTGEPLISITQRLAAIDARDGRAVAATLDVDVNYRIGDQLYVQPDARLAECFSEDEPVRMTRQEVAVARSHIEAWKAIAKGTAQFTLVLEDDVWFTPGASAAIDRGWRAAMKSRSVDDGPNLIYLSYSDAAGTVLRDEICDDLFRPVRGLWFLSGYVVSREGAARLLRSMPVVGPVDLWMNYRFSQLGVLALSSPAIAQRHDGPSDNAYSILPYLARAGIVDAGSADTPSGLSTTGPVLAWTHAAEQERLATALSMLGLRVRVFDGDEEPMDQGVLATVLQDFDALVDAPIAPAGLAAVAADKRAIVLVEAEAPTPAGLDLQLLPPVRTRTLPRDDHSDGWATVCSVLGLPNPVESFPAGAQRKFRVFRDGRPPAVPMAHPEGYRNPSLMDDSPWVLPSSSKWQPTPPTDDSVYSAGSTLVKDALIEPSLSLPGLNETFPGNLASFFQRNAQYDKDGLRLVFKRAENGPRPYQSGAFKTIDSFCYGQFEVEIKAAAGPGLVTGFFLHRDTPRQEIDIELTGDDPQRMLINVYFNPGDDGTAMGFGYRGSPFRVDLGFDATAEFHRYAIDWRPDRITWLVDGKAVHERRSWDPTPIPHLKMQLHGNLWAPRSSELAGHIDGSALPAAAVFRNLTVSE
ncbi:glycoside hydrolase [Rhodococcus sp. 15-1154-1]|nr:family 16 glycosylhydrolase [Rhodococcus sp. 15-1154-1]OZF01000.1 glycoside hydrolase [Rhodococcus sp. 15-1154-1]